MDCFVFDIDGTCADLTHRLKHIQKRPKDWDAFFAAAKDDKPSPHMQRLAYALHCGLSAYQTIVYCSGRPERTRDATVKWLCDHDFPYYAHLFMRKDGDRRNDSIIKRELLDDMRLEGLRPIMAFDDRDRVVEMWRNAGVPCAQVAKGDF
jgi:hypothetical protein